MTDLVLLVEDWRLYVGMLVMLGFAPGFLLRLMLLLYPQSDKRRAELPAELYALPRWKRPMWVAEQLETALFEGLGQRWRDRREGVNARAAIPEAHEALKSILPKLGTVQISVLPHGRHTALLEVSGIDRGEGVTVTVVVKWPKGTPKTTLDALWGLDE